MNRFDGIVIGAGQAGPSLTGRLTAAGMTVAVIERKLVGGTCVNTGCTPTKTLVASAQAAYAARRAADYGVLVEGAIRVDMAKVKARADTVAANSRIGLDRWLRDMKACTLIEGHARFEAPDRVRVGADLLTAPRIFINVGGRPSVPPLPGIHDVPFLTNRTMLDLQKVPEHLVVVGGSYIGLEFAQMHRRFGAAVTIVERLPHLIGREDAEISEAIREILTGEGVTVRTGAECIRLGRHERGVAVFLDCAEGAPTVVGSHVLLAGVDVPIPTTSGWRRPESRPTRAATSPSTIPWPPMFPGSGPWATATGGEPSRTPPSTTSRSWPPPSWTAATVASPTGFPPMRSTSTRPSDASARPRPKHGRPGAAC
jgi:pyruvate/2-oxoglutarate dehydrogenase complex dihydrolipoamide dehydrogenase (E3) component